MRRLAVRAAGWALALGLVVFLLSRFDEAKVLAAFAQAAWWAAPGALVCLLGVFSADSFATWKVFGWFAARLRFRDVLVVRGASYLLALVNYSVGQGAIVYFVHRVAQVPVLRGAATVLLIMGTNVLILLGLTSVGLLVTSEAPANLPRVVALAYGGLAVYAVLVAWRPPVLVRRAVLDVLLGAGVRGHLKAMLVRIPHTTALIALNVVVLRAFGVAVPLAYATLMLPTVFFIAVLPLTPMGLGTTEAAMVFFFSRWAPGGAETVFAAALFLRVVGLLFSATTGLVCLQSRIGREVRSAAAPAPPPEP